MHPKKSGKTQIFGNEAIHELKKKAQERKNSTLLN